jgi:hypothetical protein
MLWVLMVPAAADEVEFCVLCTIRKTPPIDTLCQMQERMIRSPDDSRAVKALPADLQRRIVKNDARWRCRCQGWHHPVCDTVAMSRQR